MPIETGILVNGRSLRQLVDGPSEPHDGACPGGSIDLSSPQVDDGPDCYAFMWHIFNLCTEAICGPDMESAFLFWLPEMGTASHPGFTAIFKYIKRPKIIRLTLTHDPDALPSSNDYPSNLRTLPSTSLGPDGADFIPTSTASVLTDILLPTTTSLLSQFIAQPTGDVAAPVELPHFDIHSGQSTSQIALSPSLEDTLETDSDCPTTQLIKQSFNVLKSKAKELLNATKEKLKCTFHTPLDGGQNSFSLLHKVSPDGAEEYHLNEKFMPHVTLESATATPYPTVSSVLASSGFEQQQQQQHRHALNITLAVLGFVVVSALIFSHIIRNPRRRAEFAAAREERRNRRLYRFAAKKWQFMRWWQHLQAMVTRRSLEEIAATWEEKQYIAIKQDLSAPGVDMQAELYAFRTAHSFVDSIIKAEEGQSRGIIQDFFNQARERQRSRRDSAASKAASDITGPPPYDEADSDAEGPSLSDDTTESSVILTSSRTSLYARDSDSEKD